MTDERFRAGILAAGRGERFVRAGVAVPKPLLRVGGKALIERAIESAAEAGASSAAVVVSGLAPEVAAFVRAGDWPIPVTLEVRTTASSFESLRALAPMLAGLPFLLLTVDAVLPPTTARELAREGLLSSADGVLGVTRLVHDEAPLRAALDGERRIVALGARAAESPWITSGVYFFRPRILAVLDEPPAPSRLRDLLGRLVERGFDLRGHATGDSIDVDDPEDLALAERALAARTEG